MCCPILTWLLASYVNACCTINPASKCQMVRRCQSPEHVHIFKTDHSIVRYTLLDATFGIPLKTKPVVARSNKGKLCIPLATEICYSEQMKGVCYRAQHWHRGFLNIKRGESSARRPPAELNPSETNREQEGDEAHCLDLQNTNDGEEEKESDLEKNAAVAWLLTVVIRASVVGLVIHEKRDRSTSATTAMGREDPITSLSLSINHLPHRHASMRYCEWTHAAPLLQRERIKKRLWEEKEGIVKKKKLEKEKKETDFPFLDIVIHKLYCPYY
jgi:hypothetical protein